jgi:D-aspartate ligase
VKAPAFVFPDNPAALATCRELGRAGVPVTLVTSRDGPACLSRYPRVLRAPDFYREPGAWLSFVVAQAGRCAEPPVLLPTEDAALLVADAFRVELSTVARFPYPARALNDGTNGNRPIPRVLDKLELYTAAYDLGIAVPEFREIRLPEAWSSSESDEKWLVKPSCRYHFDPRRGITTFLSLTGGSKAIEGSVRDAARTVLGAGFRCMAQEKIPGPFEQLVSVGLVLDRDGRVPAAFFTRKRCEYPEPFGDGLVVETIDDPGILEDSVRLLRKLGYWGICDVEYKRDARDGRFKLLDANPRTWLWVGLAESAGCTPLALSAYRLALGDGLLADSAEGERRGRAGLTWVSPRGAAAFLLRQYRPKRHGASLATALTLGALRTMLRNLRVFRDPLYVRPSTWPGLVEAATRRKNRDRI